MSNSQSSITTQNDDDTEETPVASPEERSRSVDPVRMYLRKMGTISLLTREGEIEVAKRIESGENRVIDIVLRSPAAIPHVLDLCDRVERNLVRVKDAFVLPAKNDERHPGAEDEPSSQEAALENMRNQLKRLRKHQREEKARIQLVMSDLRRLGFSDALPERAMTSGDAALRAYCTTVSGEHPSAMLGVMLALFGVAAEVSPTVVRLLSVGSVPKEAMRWLLLRQTEDPKVLKQLLEQTAALVRDPVEQAQLLQAVEVTGELLALGAAARPAA